MKIFKTKALLDNAVKDLIAQGKTFYFREANKLDGFIGWILFM